MDVVLVSLLVFMVLGSAIALEMRNLLSAVIAVGVVGLGLSIVFLLLGAPDIAITQVVVEVIVVTVMIRLTGRTGRHVEYRGPRRDLASTVFGLGLLLVLLGFTIHAFAALPEFGAAVSLPAAYYLANAPAETGATNVVTAILLDYRAYDTLGEATVILTAVVGTLVVLRHTGRSAKRAEPPRAPISPPEPRRRETDREVQHV